MSKLEDLKPETVEFLKTQRLSPFLRMVHEKTGAIYDAVNVYEYGRCLENGYSVAVNVT